MTAKTAIAAPLVRVNVVGTVVFVVTAALAAAVFTSVFQWIGAITSLVLFAVGVFTFLWGYFQAIGRSRTDEIGVAQLYLLTGTPTPSSVRRPMLGMLAVQVATAAVTTFTRLEGPDGNPGSSLAVGFLVPMFGLGLNGLWCANHGSFPPRVRRQGADATTASGDGEKNSDGQVVEVGVPISKNEPHG